MQFSFSGREKGGLLSGPGTVAAADLVRKGRAKDIAIGFERTVGFDSGS